MLYLPNASAQEVTKSNLPEGAKLRIGKGILGEIAYFPDGTRFAVATSIGIWVYDSISGEELYQLTDHTNGINSIRFSIDGKVFATEVPDGSINLWNIQTRQNILTLTDDEKDLSQTIFSPNGNVLATTSTIKDSISNKSVQLWDALTGKHLKTVTRGNCKFYNKRFSPDGKSIATWTHRDTTMQLWNVTSGEHLKTITNHDFQDFKAYFSPDGNTIATYCIDESVGLWEFSTGEFLDTLVQQDSDNFSSACFTPDGMILATGGSSNGNVDLWDVRNGKHLKTLTGHKGSVTNICFASNGKMFASGGSDGTIRLWSTTLDYI